MIIKDYLNDDENFNDDKRLFAYDGITTYPYGIGAGILCKQDLLSKVSRKC